MWEMDYDKAASVWVEKDKDSVHMEEAALKNKIDEFIKAHNTCALAVASGDLVVKHFNELRTTELYEILKTRFEIFVTEQECIYQDLDDKDQDAVHVFCWNENGRVAGCLRVFMRDAEDGVVQIGRVVTLEHGKGIGRQILHKGVEVAIEHFKAKKIYLEAQVYATGYYAKEGFEVVSDEFMEDGIPHVKMEKVITE